MADDGKQRKGEVLEQTRQKTEQPRMFKVLLHNDDYTTMEFVVQVLETVFRRSPAEAYRIMMFVHQRGIGVAGTYPFEVAETKAAQVHELARESGYPLRVSLEEEP